MVINPDMLSVGAEFIASLKFAVTITVSLADNKSSASLSLRTTVGDVLSMVKVILSTSVSSPSCVPWEESYETPPTLVPETKKV